MENSSKALLIAAAVLIVILLVTISLKILSPAEDVVEDANEIAGTISSTSKDAVGKFQSSMGITTGTPDTGEEEKLVLKVGETAKVNTTINGKQHSSSNPIIPAGFKPINTDTAKWKAEEGEAEVKLEEEVNKGLVISDGESEFVWVPLKEGTTINAVNKNGYREPDVVTGVTPSATVDSASGTQYDAVEGNLILAGCEDKNKNGKLDAYDFKQQLTEEFGFMAASVNKYRGFYVGKYETSINNRKSTINKRSNIGDSSC